MKHSQTAPSPNYYDIIQQLYLVYYGRPADPEGLEYWVARMASQSETAASVIAAFGTSAEFEEQFGTDENETLVDNLYQQIFGRPADDEGLIFYVDWLTTGEATLVDIAWRIIQGVQEGNTDALIVDNRTAVANAVTARFAEQGDDGDYDREAMRDFISGVTDDIATRDSHLTDDSLDQLMDEMDVFVPVFTSGSSFQFDENATGVVFTATATDEGGGTLTYTLDGTDARHFRIDANNAVSFITPPDYEMQDSYTLDIIATNERGIAITQTVTVAVNDIDETIPVIPPPPPPPNEPPVFDSSNNAITFDENQAYTTIVYTAVATDPEHVPVKYALIGNDADDFNIDEDTGDVRFNTSPDFETKPSYSIDVVATDGSGNSATQTVAITIGDVNDAPTFPNESRTYNFTENMTNAIFGPLQANDVDDGEDLTYSLGGAHASLFKIGNFEQIYFKTPPNFEDGIDYDLTVIATDKAGLTATVIIDLTVTDLNDVPVFKNDLAGPISFIENDTGTVFTIPEASDEDLGDSITYELRGIGADKLQVNQDTRVVTFIKPPDYEIQPSYNLTLIASDGVLEATQDITLTIDDSNDAPIFANAEENVDFDENQPIATAVFTPFASHADNDAITYTLSGKDEDKFTIDDTTHEVTFKVSPDYEFQSSYQFIVTASDGPLTDTQTVNITIGDVDERPVFDSGNKAITFDENQDTSTTVYTAIATDPEGKTVNYSLVGRDADKFNIHATTGVVTFVTSPDFETGPSYLLEVRASDGGGLVQDQSIVVNIGNVEDETAPLLLSSAPADNAPAFWVADNIVLTFDENIEFGTGFITIFKADDTIVRSFDVSDGNTNVISISNAVLTIDLPNPLSQNTHYYIKIDPGAIEDTSGNPYAGFTDTTTLNFTTANRNDEPFFINVKDSYDVAENTTAIFTARGGDPDGDGITYTLEGADSDKFSIDSNTNVVTFKNPLDFETDKTQYTLLLKATDDGDDDGGTGNLSVTKMITINLTDEDEGPDFTSSDADIEFDENLPVATTVYRAAAIDPEGSVVTYSLTGTDKDDFSIDPTSGVVTFADSPNFEDVNIYTLIVRASSTDPGNTTKTKDQSITINITDIDEDPVFTSSGDPVTFDELQPSTTIVYTAIATDPEGPVKYALIGNDAGDFNIDEDTGDVRFKTAPNFESNKTSYSLGVSATDSSNNSVTQTVAITIGDVNDAPEFKNPLTGPLDFEENDTAIAFTIPVASDEDGDTLVYSLEGTDSGDFDINGRVVTFKNPPNHEQQDSYTLTMVATEDNGQGSLSTSQDITINITDIDEAPEFTSGGDAIPFAENQVTTITVYTAQATDPEGSTVTYSVEGTDKDHFNIDATSGVVTFDASPDYEDDDSYTLTVRASSGAGNTIKTTDQSITINITDVNERPVFDRTIGTVNFTENGTGQVFDASATDPDEGQTLSYALSGTDNAKFTIDTTSGVVTFVNVPDYETDAHTYAVTVTATDNGTGTLDVSQDVTVNLVNVLELTADPYQWNPETGKLTINFDTALTTATATEVNDGTQVIAGGITGNSANFDFSPFQGTTTHHIEDYLFSITSGTMTYTDTLNIDVNSKGFTVTTETGTVLLNTLNGTTGDDIIDTSIDGVLVYALGGDDLIRGDDNNLTVYGGAGTDGFSFVNYGSLITNLFVDADLTNLVSGFIEFYWKNAQGDILKTIKIDSIENIVGAGGPDILTGDDGPNTLDGGIGDDVLSGGKGADVLTGGSGNDRLSGGMASDVLTGGAGEDTFIFFSAETGTGADEITDFLIDKDIIDLSDYINNGIKNVDNPELFEVKSQGGVLTHGITIIDLGDTELNKIAVVKYLADPNNDGSFTDAITIALNSVSLLMVTNGTDSRLYEVKDINNDTSIDVDELTPVINLTGLSNLSSLTSDQFLGFA